MNSKSIKYVLKIEMFGSSIVFYTNHESAYNFIANKNRIFNYSFQINNSIFTDNEHWCLFYQDSHYALEVDFKNKQMLLSAPWFEIIDSTLLRCLIMTILELNLQIDGKVLLHSSSVSYMNKGYIFWGSSNSGKTTLSLIFCRKYGATFISSDMTAIKAVNDNIIITSGNELINVRNYSTYRTDFILHECLFSNTLYEKRLVNANSITKCETQMPIKCNYVIISSVYLDSKNYNIREVNKEDLLLSKARIYNQISEAILGNKYIFLNNTMNIIKDLKLESLDTKKFYEMRIEIIEKIFKFCKILICQGNPHEIIDNIKNISTP